MNSMAEAFSVSSEFLDKEISDFIVAGRLHAKIDKVAGVIETNRCHNRSTICHITDLSSGSALSWFSFHFLIRVLTAPNCVIDLIGLMLEMHYISRQSSKEICC